MHEYEVFFAVDIETCNIISVFYFSGVSQFPQIYRHQPHSLQRHINRNEIVLPTILFHSFSIYFSKSLESPRGKTYINYPFLNEHFFLQNNST